MAELIINERVVFRIHIHNQLWNFIIISGCVVVVVELAWKKNPYTQFVGFDTKICMHVAILAPKYEKKYWIHV